MPKKTFRPGADPDPTPGSSKKKTPARKGSRKGSFLGSMLPGSSGKKKDKAPQQAFDMGDQRMSHATAALATPSMRVAGAPFDQMRANASVNVPTTVAESSSGQQAFPRPRTLAGPNDPRRSQLLERITRLFAELDVSQDPSDALEWGLANGESALSAKLQRVYGRPLPKPTALESASPAASGANAPLMNTGSFVEYDADRYVPSDDPHSSFVALAPPFSPMTTGEDGEPRLKAWSSNVEDGLQDPDSPKKKGSHVDSIDFESKPAATEEDSGPGVCATYVWGGRGTFGVCKECKYSRSDHNPEKLARDKERRAGSGKK